MNSLRWLSGVALALTVGPAVAAEPQLTRIIVPEVEVRSGPTASYYATSKLHQDDVVDVLGVEQGMLKIAPPPGSFDWVNAADLDVRGATGTVIKTSDLRRGSVLNAQKDIGVVALRLEIGTQLSVLSETQMAGKEVLVKVRPPANDVRYIPGDSVANIPGVTPRSSAGTNPVIPGFGQENLPPPLKSFETPNSASMPSPSFATQDSRAAAPGSSRKPGGHAATVPPIESPGSLPIVPTTFVQAADGAREELLPPTSWDRGSARGQASATIPQYDVVSPYAANPQSMSRSNRLAASLSDDPDWVEGERLEEFYAQNKNLGDLQLAISHYDKVGKKYGQIDPNLALRAMNRAQYLRNAISAGVLDKTTVSRSAKQNYSGSVITEAYPGQPNKETRKAPIRTAQTDVYATPSELPSVASSTANKSKAPTGLIELDQPTAKLTKPLVPSETPPSGAKRVICSGILERTSVEAEGKRFYRLMPDEKAAGPFVYCTNQPGVNLEDVVNKHVEIYGSWYYHSVVRQNYMEVLEVRLLPYQHQ